MKIHQSFKGNLANTYANCNDIDEDVGSSPFSLSLILHMYISIQDAIMYTHITNTVLLAQLGLALRGFLGNTRARKKLDEFFSVQG